VLASGQEAETGRNVTGDARCTVHCTMHTPHAARKYAQEIAAHYFGRPARAASHPPHNDAQGVISGGSEEQLMVVG
jgi:hypothetical protein